MGNLDRHKALQVDILRFVDDSTCSATKLLQENIVLKTTGKFERLSGFRSGEVSPSTMSVSEI